MKLRNIILTATALALCSSAFAASTSVMSQGGTYVGLAGGWGSITSDSNAVNLLNTWGYGPSGSQSGGFSGRVYVGYLMSTTNDWSFGPELGYSYYANNNYTSQEWNNDNSNLNIKQSGYGIDILLNATYMLSNTFNIAIKPGFQYAFEKFTDNDDTDTFPGSASVNHVMPEINIGANWQAFADKPFFLGASYQYVWGNSADHTIENYSEGRNLSTSSRDMFALNLEYMFH